MKLSHLTVAMIFLAGSAMAQHVHPSNSVSETGQAQFAAISEIVAMLRADPDTVWEQIDIDALRAHLVDMDNGTMKAMVETTIADNAVTFSVTGNESTAASVQRMVSAHSPMLQQEMGLSVAVEDQSNGAKMTIQTASKDDLDKVYGLGFFGLMTVGAHHQKHHQMIAIGMSPH